MGEDAPEGYDLYSSEEVDYDNDDELNNAIKEHFKLQSRLLIWLAQVKHQKKKSPRYARLCSKV